MKPFKPAEKYKPSLRQTYACVARVRLLEKQVDYWKGAYLEKARADLSLSKARLESELQANEVLTTALLAAEARIEELEAE
jgi:hypothetical protein